MRFAPFLAATAVAAFALLVQDTAATAGGIEFGPVQDAPRAKPQRKQPAPVPAPPAPESGAPETAAEAEIAPPPAPTPAAIQAPAVPQASGGRVSTKGLPPPPAPRNCKTSWSYESWLRDFKREAAAEGIDRKSTRLNSSH